MEEKDTQKNVTPPTSQPRSRKKFLLFMAITFANLFGVSAASVAWFLTVAKQATISAVSGDLNVDIQKVTAYKYVYPYYEGTTEFINYDGQGTVKSYVVEDGAAPEAITNDPATFSLTKTSGTCLRSPGETSPTNIYYHLEHDYSSLLKDVRYYLIGDSVFNGVSTYPWSTKTAIPLSSTSNTEASAMNVVVSKGAKFIFFDANGVSSTSCHYFSYSLSATNGRFAVNNGAIECLKSGIYTFSYEKITTENQGDTYSLTIEMGTRDDEAIIGNGILDTTKVSIDYYGMDSATRPATIEDYLPEAIHDQNTMVIFDVELKYKNPNPITAGLKIVRNNGDSDTVYSYSNGTQHLKGVTTIKNGNVITIERNPVHASDFYSFYAMFTTEENAFVDGWIFKDTVADMSALGAVTGMVTNDVIQVTDAGEGAPKPFRYDGEEWVDVSELTPPTAVDNLWDAMHVQRTTELTKFHNDTDPSFLTSIPCPLNPKESDDSLTVPVPVGGEGNITRHCYIAVDYDYEHMQFFMNENRLGKTYYLDRDFGFYFTGTQVDEAASPQQNQGD